MKLDTLKPYSYKRRTLSNGELIYTLSEVKNGLIHIEPLSVGKIVYHSNQVEANVWIFNKGTYANEPINQALQIDNFMCKNGKFEGVVLNLDGRDFAIKYRAKEHNDITVKEEQALSLPLFTEWKEKRVPACTFKGNERESYYLLETVIDLLETNFKRWIDNQKFVLHDLSEQELEDSNYGEGVTQIFSDKDQELIVQKKQDVELAFAKSTGIYYEFTGGLVWE
ncbi:MULTISPECIES: hypothetical protein [Bacillus cereus group]|uniref:Uncharacterized protein n=1 Tax=Bacillus cereus 03BB108 TaxID=451709 RepID=A0AAN0W4P8_BACCE|nr:hypothetical protein [Bacillus cereus]AJI09013.1 hypothetical protein AK40_5763 [Bacillus cereus 03BB108]EDX59929.1 hypothetical protein BC03BB108_B0071 [Bacillus cereus 03BB108]QKG99229.1 hypothetical protein FOC96_02930 [Bacillus cereus]HDR7255035.1 hypothetical protein [Bacillus pacificus]